MTTNSTNKPPIWFWIVSLAALLWNSAGAYMYLQQAYNTEVHQAMYTPEQLEMVNNMPSWATAAFAIAVFGGVLGCIGLLLRKKWAKSIFLLSLLGIIAHQIIYNLFMSGAMEEYGSSAMIFPILTFIIGGLLLLFTNKSIAKHWLS